MQVVEFGELEETGVGFYKALLRSLLLENSEETVTAIFSRLAPLPSLKTFRTELILFIKHFLGPTAKATPPAMSLSMSRGGGDLRSRIRLAEQAMKSHGHLF